MNRLHVVAADVARSGNVTQTRAYFRENATNVPTNEPGEIYLQLGDMAHMSASVRLTPSQIQFLAIEFVKWLEQPDVMRYMEREREVSRERVRLWLLEQEARKEISRADRS